MEEEIMELRSLIMDIMDTLDGRDDSVKDWISERYSNIKNTIDTE